MHTRFWCKNTNRPTWKIYAQMGDYYDGSYETNWENIELTCITQYVGKWQAVLRTVTLSLYLTMVFSNP